MRRPTRLPRPQRRRDLWDRCGNWILAAFAVVTYFVVVHVANS